MAIPRLEVEVGRAPRRGAARRFPHGLDLCARRSLRPLGGLGHQLALEKVSRHGRKVQGPTLTGPKFLSIRTKITKIYASIDLRDTHNPMEKIFACPSIEMSGNAPFAHLGVYQEACGVRVRRRPAPALQR